MVGGGQSGLAVGYYLRRTGLSYIILDQNKESGGAWVHTWKSLRLFSPAQWSSLPGMIMPGGGNYYPTRDEAITYLKNYELKYDLPVKRGIEVTNVVKHGDFFEIETTDGVYQGRALVSATGTFSKPYIPSFVGIENFRGTIIHSSEYDNAEPFIGKRVAIIGEGNSGAQILAELSKVTDTLWVTAKQPRFLPDHIDGRYLFDAATQMYEAQKSGRSYIPPSLGDIVMVESVKDARERHALNYKIMLQHFTKHSIVCSNGDEEKIDAVIFCTGFKPALSHLSGLDITNQNGRADTIGTRSSKVENLWFVGYGNWTGFASATLIGVGRSARQTVEEIVAALHPARPKHEVQ